MVVFLVVLLIDGKAPHQSPGHPYLHQEVVPFGHGAFAEVAGDHVRDVREHFADGVLGQPELRGDCAPFQPAQHRVLGEGIDTHQRSETVVGTAECQKFPGGIQVVQFVQPVYGHGKCPFLLVPAYGDVFASGAHVLDIQAADQSCELLVLGAMMTQHLLCQHGPESRVMRHRGFVPARGVGGDVAVSPDGGGVFLEGIVAQIAPVASGIRRRLGVRQVQVSGIPRLGLRGGQAY